VAFTGRLSAWLAKAGVSDPDARATLAVGLADFISAARQVEADLEAALTFDTDVPEEADRALSYIAGIPPYLFGEARDHADDMEPFWETHLEEGLLARGVPEPPDGDESSDPPAS
jgi:hypothetical protein